MAKGNRNRNKTNKGESAISSIIRNSKDQIVKAVKGRYTGNSAPANIANDIKTIMSLMNTEAKCIDTIAGAQTVSSAVSLVYGLGTIAQGAAGNQRSGDSVKINKIDLLMKFAYDSGTPATTAQLSQVFNWYLVRYLKTASTSGTTAFAIGDFLVTDGNGQYTPISLPNNDLNENFQVMASGTQELNFGMATTNLSALSCVESVSHPCSYHQTYTGSASTTIVDNMTFLVVVALNPVNTGGGSTICVSSRMWYVDN